jgi:formate--tetrahydrofolate ligase
MSRLAPISAVAEELGLHPDDLSPYGRDKAKISLEALNRPGGPGGRLVLVSAINPTPGGEGKTTMSIALAMGLRRRGKLASLALREPSLGPVFGMKGGATGGGAARIEPAESINLHFTGDLHAITAAHNLLAALVDNDLYFGSKVGLEARKTTWGRALDMNDRSLRKVIVGLGGDGVPRETRFDITAASEVMAILCLSSSIDDLQARLAKIVIGRRKDGTPVTCGALGAAPAMTALLREAIQPNLVQTAEGGAAIVHGGPFANIAHGCSSLLGTRIALHHADWVITEAGFGFDLGAEKFADIKCRQPGSPGLWPSAVVIVATLRALKMHGGAAVSNAADANAEALARGVENLEKHLETAAALGLRPVVALNVFGNDPASELAWLESWAADHGVRMARCTGFVDGGAGAEALADAVIDAGSAGPGEQRPLYPLDASYPDKIRAIARTAYGASDVIFAGNTEKQLEKLVSEGYGGLPVCMAKTQYSLTDDPKVLGRPRNFTVTVREVRLSAGAGFVVALLGDMMTMPGLPKEPAAYRVQVHPDGRVTGLMQGE